MSAVKMNVLHLHLTDDEGFRMESKVYPKLHLMGSSGNFYTQAEMKGLIEYARLRGIMVIPEFDLPGHARSWFAGYPELASIPGVYQPGHRFESTGTKSLGEIMTMVNTTPTPTIDPTKEYTYQFLDKLIGEMSTVFPAAYFHIGADENNGAAWKSNAAIVAFMKKNNIPDAKALEHYFVMRMHSIVKKHHRTMIGWEELFNKDIPKDLVVQKWKPEMAMMGTPLKAETIIAQGNPVLLSSGFYLDHHMPAHVYYNNPVIPTSEITDPVIKTGMLGGEAAQWTEIADAENIEGRVWPGAAAVAERLWSPASVRDVDDMYRRLNIVNLLLDERGLQQFGNQDKALRRLTGTEDISSVKLLTDVLTPVRGYKRLFATMSKPAESTSLTAPLNHVADIVFVNSQQKRVFRDNVKKYLQKDSIAEAAVRRQLREWVDAEQQWNAYKGNKILMEVFVHAQYLSQLSAAALEAMDLRKKGPVGEDWLSAKKELIKKASSPAGETELAVLQELEAVITGILKSEPAQYSLF
jgi:hexosaminidase